MPIRICLTCCAVLSVNGIAIMSQNVPTLLSVINVLKRDMSMTIQTVQIWSTVSIVKLKIQPSPNNVLSEKKEKELISTKYAQNISFPELRRIIEQRQKDKDTLVSNTRYANITSQSSEKHNCQT